MNSKYALQLSGVVLALVAMPVQAATFTVTTVADGNDGVCDSHCTLREAVAAADASVADDIIEFEPALFGIAQTITLSGTDIVIAGNGTLLVDGPGEDRLTISGDNASRVITNGPGATTMLEGMRLIHGNGVSTFNSGRGGAVYNNGGTLTLRRVALIGNSANTGGGVNTANQGSTRLESCVVSNNDAALTGGGIQNLNLSALTVINTTVSDNVANSSSGGGGALLNGVVTVINSTFSGNSAVTGSGGGIYSNGPQFLLINSTISGNSSAIDGGGLHRVSANLDGYLRNSVIAGNSGDDASPDVTSTTGITSLGHNLIGVGGTSAGWIASDLLDTDPLLAPLADYGGTNATHALSVGSPAIDAGDDCVLDASCAGNNAPFILDFDQRGFPRPVGPAVDIGAFESALDPIELPIYDNGGLATGIVSNSGVIAPPGSGWSELQNDTGVTEFANGILGWETSVSGGTGLRIADDFTVPPGEAWTIDSAVFYAHRTNFAGVTSPIATYTLRVWDGVPDAPGSSVLCGDEDTNQLVASDDTGLWRIGNSQVPAPGITPTTTRRIWASTVAMPVGCAGPGAFPAGTYWLDWDSRSATSTSHFRPTAAVPGARFRPGDNALVRGSVGWTNALDFGRPLAAPDVPQDFPFQLYGSVGPAVIFANGFELP